jgi:uncharacterized protein (TIGR02421 family)
MSRNRSSSNRPGARFVDTVLADLRGRGSSRRRLPGGGRLYVDRPMPFLCLYREPRDRPDPGTGRLVASEAAFLIGTTEKGRQRELRDLVKAVAAYSIERFGAFLVVEVWAAAGGAISDQSKAASPVPGFRVFTYSRRGLNATLRSLTERLERIRILKRPATVQLVQGRSWGQREFKPLLTRDLKRMPDLRVIGVEVQPFYQNGDGEVFPIALRRLRRQFSVALKRTFHLFATRRSLEVPVSYQALGQRKIPRNVLKIDRRLSELAGAYDFVLEVTPVNLDATWSRFKRQRFEREPVFYYRPLPIDPAAFKRKLFAISTEQIEEPTLAELFREKQLGIDRELSAMLDRGTSRFIHHGMLIYGGVSAELTSTAAEILARIPPRIREAKGKGYLDAAGFAAHARAEIEHYRSKYSGFTTTVEIRDDLYSGLMVSRGNLMIGRRARIPVTRVEALLQHEIGTHALTYHAGRAQPLRLLCSGLPGYDEFQEGIAVIAEYLVGGLSRARLRLLAGRVVAIEALLGGASFIDTFRRLFREHGFDQKTAFTIAVRTYRGGGLTKDGIYLRGLLKVMRYLARGGDYETLLVGKIASHHVRMMKELLLREVLKPAPVRARYLDDPDARARLSRLRDGGSVFDLTRGGV